MMNKCAKKGNLEDEAERSRSKRLKRKKTANKRMVAKSPYAGPIFASDSFPSSHSTHPPCAAPPRRPTGLVSPSSSSSPSILEASRQWRGSSCPARRRTATPPTSPPPPFSCSPLQAPALRLLPLLLAAPTRRILPSPFRVPTRAVESSSGPTKEEQPPAADEAQGPPPAAPAIEVEELGWGTQIAVKLRMLLDPPWKRVRKGSVLNMKLRGEVLASLPHGALLYMIS